MCIYKYIHTFILYMINKQNMQGNKDNGAIFDYHKQIYTSKHIYLTFILHILYIYFTILLLLYFYYILIQTSYINILYVMCSHINTEIVCIEQQGDRQPSLRAEFKLVKFLYSATKYLSL